MRFVELSEGLGFREAAEVLAGTPAGLLRFAHGSTTHRGAPVGPTPTLSLERDSDELAALRAATSLYHRRLLTDSEALEYVEQRGLDRAAIDTCQIGYAAGDELVPFLRWRRIELGPALRVGLLDRCGQEFLAGRIVVPELRDGQPVWLAGRLLGDTETPIVEAGNEPPPKYLVLRGSKPLLGASAIQGSEAVIVVEGVFDVLTLRRWGYPAVALLGTHARPDIIEQLRRFRRIYLVLDQDDGGVEATLRLADLLGPAAIPVALPDGTKDVAQLARLPDGQTVFASALLEAVGALQPDPTVSTNCA